MNKKSVKKLVSFKQILLSFFCGMILGTIILLSTIVYRFEKTYQGKIYPGVIINNIDFSGNTQKEIENYFAKINLTYNNTRIYFKEDDKEQASASATELGLGYDQKMIAEQAYLLGRGPYILSNIILKIKARLETINLTIYPDINKERTRQFLQKIALKINHEPQDALFNFSAGRVVAFKPSSDGKKLNIEQTTDKLSNFIKSGQHDSSVSATLIIDKLKPKITTENANNLGIKELIGVGTSTFFHSIPNRVHNVGLAASRLNGILISPGETFSFNNYLGDISGFTGYRAAYVIQNGRTVLGDGGGVCQVSTTFFRAALNAGLPITERWEHSYRVGYYEQDQPPGLDATVFSPVNDLKFINNTPGSILIQTAFDPVNYQLAVYFYGQKDGRISSVSKPVITNQSSAPPDLYQDDPSLPKGEIRQVDFAAPGARSSFDYLVTKNGSTLFAKTFISNYKPWQAIFLRGTKE